MAVQPPTRDAAGRTKMSVSIVDMPSFTLVFLYFGRVLDGMFINSIGEENVSRSYYTAYRKM